MNTEPTNPYRSPAIDAAATVVPRGASIIRGLLCAIPLGIVGFAIPVALALLRYWGHGNSRYSLISQVCDNSHTWIWGSCGCALVFALAAVLNYAPASRLDLFSAIALVALAMIGGMLISRIAWPLNSYHDDPWAWHRVLTAASVPVIYAWVHTAVRLRLPAKQQGRGAAFH